MNNTNSLYQLGFPRHSQDIAVPNWFGFQRPTLPSEFNMLSSAFSNPNSHFSNLIAYPQDSIDQARLKYTSLSLLVGHSPQLYFNHRHLSQDATSSGSNSPVDVTQNSPADRMDTSHNLNSPHQSPPELSEPLPLLTRANSSRTPSAFRHTAINNTNFSSSHQDE